MQAIAKEMNFSETTFVLPAEAPGTDVRMRIFTPGEELPMAGHPTIGSTFALARVGAIEPRRDRFVFGLGVGPTPVTLTWKGDDLSFAWMTQLNPDLRRADREQGGRGRGCSACRKRRLPGTALPVQQISCGVPFLFVPLATRARSTTRRWPPGRFDEFKRASKIDAHGVFLFSVAPGNDRAHVYSRMFAPEMGVGRRSGDRQRERSARVLPREARGHRAEQSGRDAEPARREDGPAEPRAHFDRHEGRRDHVGARRRRIGARRRGDVVHLKRQKAEGKGQKAEIAQVFRRAKELR